MGEEPKTNMQLLDKPSILYTRKGKDMAWSLISFNFMMFLWMKIIGKLKPLSFPLFCVFQYCIKH